MDASAGIPEFGERLPGHRYRHRPGAYAVIFDADRRVAVVRTRSGSYLPGGGCHLGDSAEATLSREVREECGREIDILRRLGEAIDVLSAAPDALGLIKHGVFFEATFGQTCAVTIEEDHLLTWLPPREAALLLSNRSHGWAVERALPLEW